MKHQIGICIGFIMFALCTISVYAAPADNLISHGDVDVVIFMGQSNMSGFGGDAALAPKLIKGAGYEFRAISDPTTLYPIEEPFGHNENVEDSINDADMKRGSMVTAFANSYYTATGVPVVAVSASKGGSTIDWWNREEKYTDAINRLQATKDYLGENSYHVKNSYMVWLQGESDGFNDMSTDAYIARLKHLGELMFDAGVDKCFIITVGSTLLEGESYDDIILADVDICEQDDRFMIASTMLGLLSRDYFTDDAHYNQYALNKLGNEAGRNMGFYTNTDISPSVIDPLYEKKDIINDIAAAN